ncbi:DUF255 domain-containing protein [Paenibacillus sp. FSL E2-0178]|uniref:DUF255 domain-containing protein n=1 Tax=Paenibacillus sp. FSL E2-0178 TaxID=2921361 RepID=UPI003158AC01
MDTPFLTTCHWCHVMEHVSFEDKAATRSVQEPEVLTITASDAVDRMSYVP